MNNILEGIYKAKDDYRRWLEKRLKDGHTVKEHMKYVNASWFDENNKGHLEQFPDFPEAVKFVNTLALDEINHLHFHHSNSYVY